MKLEGLYEPIRRKMMVDLVFEHFAMMVDLLFEHPAMMVS